MKRQRAPARYTVNLQVHCVRSGKTHEQTLGDTQFLPLLSCSPKPLQLPTTNYFPVKFNCLEALSVAKMAVSVMA